MATFEQPLILLAGRDRRPSALPDGRADLHLLRGYKAMEVEIGGEPLIVRLLERLRDGGVRGPVFVAGPARVYADLAGEVRLVDTDGDFGENIRASLEAVRESGFQGQVAVMTSDVLPEADELQAALADFERHQPCDFWMVQCRADRQKLGASAWKPRYFLRPEGESGGVATLPGHLFMADPRNVRLDLLYTLFELAYRTRNRPTAYRRSVIVKGILMTLLASDLKRLATFRRPVITRDMLWNGLTLIKKTTAPSGVGQREMEDRLRRIWVRASVRRRHPERRGRVMIHDGISLARDIDTEEEAREAARRLEEEARVGD
jgi:hypothetical protein